MEWLKWYVGASTDPKMAVVARRSGQNGAAVLAVWAMLLERAGTADDAGSISGFDAEGADVVLGLQDGAACAIMDAMRAKGMLDGDRVARWEERQKKNETAAATERKQLQREREKLAAEQARLEALREELAALSHPVTTQEMPSPSVTPSHGLSHDVTTCHASSSDVTDVTLREDKKREDIKNIYSASAAPDAGHTIEFYPPGESGNASSPSPPIPDGGKTAEPPNYRTKRGRTLSGKRLESFLDFWTAFDYQRGKAEAADAWLDIPELTDALVARICDAARQEAERRDEFKARGGTPKMAQGWLTGRRWEDYEPAPPGRKREEWPEPEPPAADWETVKANLLAIAKQREERNGARPSPVIGA